LRLLALRQADTIYIAGSGFKTVTVADSIFTNNYTRINVNGSGNLPTSKLTMQYLNHYLPTLMYKGYHANKFTAGGTAEKSGGVANFMPAGKFFCLTDIQTQQELSNANPALSAMYQAADFEKGGKFFAYGVMRGVGDWLFKVDPTPMRFINTSAGILLRVWPYQNVAATIGKKPQFDSLYENAPYQLSHVYARQARQVFTSNVEQVNPDMPFLARSLNGRWTWKTPDAFPYFDINSGSTCTY
jgi:hypothetical protein